MSGLSIGSVYYTKSFSKDGKRVFDNKPYQVIEKLDWVRYRIKFLETGYECVRHRKNIIKGWVKDPYNKYVCNGIGAMGNIICKDHKKLYRTWHCILTKCYNTESPGYPFNGGIGITVCDRWKIFEYFVKDIKTLKGYENYVNSKKDYVLVLKNRFTNSPNGPTEYNLENVEIMPLKLYKSRSTAYYKSK